MINNKCIWNPSKHDGESCPTHNKNNFLINKKNLLDTVSRAKPEFKNNTNDKCYQSAFNNVLYFNKIGKKPVLHFGSMKDKVNAISHVWVEVDGKIYQTRNPNNYKLFSVASKEIVSDNDLDAITKIKDFIGGL